MYKKFSKLKIGEAFAYRKYSKIIWIKETMLRAFKENNPNETLIFDTNEEVYTWE